VISDLENQGLQVVLVTSGAIGVGTSLLKLPERPREMREKQAAAAVGQCELMHLYSKMFAEYGHIVGQILLTRDVLHGDDRKKNVENTFEALLEKRVIPIVNENDSVGVEEIEAGLEDTFNENDRLSALVAKIIKADLLVILSDVDGFYNGDPKTDKNAVIWDTVACIDDEMEKSAGGAGTERGTGGMTAKLQAAKIATAAGVCTVLANGEDPSVIRRIVNGEIVGTLFQAKK
jgi:glutamate 5-kinase